MKKKCMGEISIIIPTQNIGIKNNLSYEEILVQILDCQVCTLRTKEITSVRELWRNQLLRKLFRESEEDKIRDRHIYSDLKKFQIKMLIFFLITFNYELACCLHLHVGCLKLMLVPNSSKSNILRARMLPRGIFFNISQLERTSKELKIQKILTFGKNKKICKF